jgi:hypothetical protein
MCALDVFEEADARQEAVAPICPLHRIFGKLPDTGTLKESPRKAGRR